MARRPPDETDKAFSEIVRKARKNRIDKSEFSSTTVAKAIGIAMGTYSRKERGRHKWTLSEAIAVCKFLGIKNIEIGDL